MDMSSMKRAHSRYVRVDDSNDTSVLSNDRSLNLVNFDKTRVRAG